MRTLSKGRLARATAYLLTLVFSWSMGLTGLLTLPAEAQIVTRAATSQSVAVVPFANKTDFHPETMGDEAAAAVAVELRDRLLLDVLPKADITLQMRDLGMTVPLSNLELVRLATELDIALVITGEVRGARIVKEPGGRYGEVVLAVRLFDRVARVDVNGAIAIGKSPSSIDASNELLLQKALEQAAFSAIAQMKARPTIGAMVLWARGDTVFLNVGSRGGLRPGMYLVAVRGNEPIAKVKVDSVDAIGSYGSVVEGAPLRTGDNLRAVYELPSGPGPDRPGVAQEKRKKFESVVLAGAVLLGLGAFGNRSRRMDEGNYTIPNLKVSALSNGQELGVAMLDFGMDQFGPTNLITWDRPSNTEAVRIVGYEFYRNDEFIEFVYAGFLAETRLFDPEFSFGTPVVDTLGIEDVLNGSTSFSREFPDNPTLGITAAPDSITYGYIGSSPSPMTDYQYRVKPVFLKRVQVAPGSYEWILERTSEFTTSPQRVHTFWQPQADEWQWVFAGFDQGVYEIWDILPNPIVSGNLATFSFYEPFGADEAIIQVTRDPNDVFSPGLVYEQTVPLGVFVPDIVQVDLSLVPGTGSIFWWRIGARNRLDTLEPRPWPNPDDLSNPDRGWVWTTRNRFTLTLGAAARAAAAAHEERDALTRLRASGSARVPSRVATERVFRKQ